MKEIALARGTGGVDEDGVPGDEGLMVVVVPRDEDGAAVKVPAKVQIAAWEITPAGLKNPIGTWDVPAEKVRPTWRSGFVSTGYFVAVPWQTYPSQEKVRVAVRLTTLDGRAFEADKDIIVKPVATPRTGPSAAAGFTPIPPVRRSARAALPRSAPARAWRNSAPDARRRAGRSSVPPEQCVSSSQR